jgi:NADH dehydrogenase FAD-containing subunit
MKAFEGGTESLPKIVIVGGGFGGLTAAKALAGKEVLVTLIDRTNHHLFQPLLYQVATAGLSPADIAQPIRHILKEAQNVEVVLGEVVKVDAETKQLHTADNLEYHYDYLILAAGARHSYFGHDEWEEFAPGLKSLEDAVELRRRILSAFETAEMSNSEERRQAALTFAVVGAGPTGVEMAGAIAGEKPKAFRYFDKGSMATIGRNKAIADLKFTRLSGFLAWLTWLFVHLLFLIGLRNRLLVLFQWACSYFTFSRGARLIYGTFRPMKEPMPPANEFLDPVDSRAATGAITHQQPIPKN